MTARILPFPEPDEPDDDLLEVVLDPDAMSLTITVGDALEEWLDDDEDDG